MKSWIGLLAVVMSCSSPMNGSSGDLEADGPADAGDRCSGADAGGAIVLAPEPIGANPSGIAANSTHVFWADYGQPGAQDGAIRKVRKTCGTPVMVASSPKPQTLIATETAVVFTDETGLIRRAPVDGGDATTIAMTEGKPGRLATDGQDVYFADSGGIKSVPIAGGSVRMITNLQGSMTLTIVGSVLVFADYTNGTVSSIPVVGGKVTMLATAQKGPLYPVSDGTNLYWMNAGDLNQRDDAAVMKVNLASGGTPEVLGQGSDLFHAHGLVVEGEGLFMLTEGYGLLRVSRTGGPIVHLQALTHGGNALAADAMYLYFTWLDAGVMRMAE